VKLVGCYDSSYGGRGFAIWQFWSLQKNCCSVIGNGTVKGSCRMGKKKEEPYLKDGKGEFVWLFTPKEDDSEQRFLSRVRSLLKYSISNSESNKKRSDINRVLLQRLEQWRSRSVELVFYLSLQSHVEWFKWVILSDLHQDRQQQAKKIHPPFRLLENLLLGCMPPLSSSLLTKPYRKLMSSPDSPLNGSVRQKL